MSAGFIVWVGWWGFMACGAWATGEKKAAVACGATAILLLACGLGLFG